MTRTWAAKKEFHPEAWIFCHENMVKLKDAQCGVDGLCNRNPLMRFKLDHELIKWADFDTLEKTVFGEAQQGKKAIKVLRLDTLTLLEKLTATALSRSVARLGASVQEARVWHVDQHMPIKPEQSVIDALDPTKLEAKLEPSALLADYVKALCEWAVKQESLDRKGFKKEYQPLFKIIDKYRKVSNVVEAVNADIWIAVTGMKEQATGTAAARTQLPRQGIPR